jgi:hypothetical protein
MVKKIIVLLAVLLIISCDFGLEDGSDLVGRWVCTDNYDYDLTFFADGTGFNNEGSDYDELWFEWRVDESDNWDTPADPDVPMLYPSLRNAPYKMIYITSYTDNTFTVKREWDAVFDLEYYFTDDKSKLYVSTCAFSIFHPCERRDLLDSYEKDFSF